MIKYLTLLLCLLTLSACSNAVKVKPWERGYLAQAIMQDETGLDKALESHTFLSKEASTGGDGVASGGCGCN